MFNMDYILEITAENGKKFNVNYCLISPSHILIS